MSARKFEKLSVGAVLRFRFVVGGLGLRAVGRQGLLVGLVCCLLFGVFGVVGSGVAFGMKPIGQSAKKVSKVVKRFLEAGDRDHHFRDELGDFQRLEILGALPVSEGARLLGLITSQKELKSLWKGLSLVDSGLQDGVWPYLNENAKLLMVGDGKESEGFLSEKKQRRLVEVQDRFNLQEQIRLMQEAPPILPGATNGRIVFDDNLVRFLGRGDVCRLVLVCDHVSSRGRVYLSERVQSLHESGLSHPLRQLAPTPNTNDHWVKWVKASERERPTLFAELSDGAAFEIWNSASVSSKDWLYSQLPTEQRGRVLSFEGGVYEQIMNNRFEFGRRTIALDAESFQAVLPTIWVGLSNGERRRLLESHPVLGVKDFFTNLLSGWYDTQPGQHSLEQVSSPGVVDLRASIWPKLELRGRVSWLKNVEPQGDPVAYGFFHDLMMSRIGGEGSAQVKHKALAVNEPGEVVEQVWDLLTEEDRQKLTDERKRQIEVKQRLVEEERQRRVERELLLKQRLWQQREERKLEVGKLELISESLERMIQRLEEEGQKRLEQERLEQERQQLLEKEKQRLVEERELEVQQLKLLLGQEKQQRLQQEQQLQEKEQQVEERELEVQQLKQRLKEGQRMVQRLDQERSERQKQQRLQQEQQLQEKERQVEERELEVGQLKLLLEQERRMVQRLTQRLEPLERDEREKQQRIQLERESQRLEQQRWAEKKQTNKLLKALKLPELKPGHVSTVAGFGTDGFGGDNGLATSAQLNDPFGVFVSLDGDVFIADNHNHRVRRVSPGGVISTVAGSGTLGFGGDNGPATSAQLNYPSGVFVTLDGHIYIADTWNHRVRRVSPQGVISTVAGDGTRGFGGDNGPATSAQLNYPSGVFATLDGHLFIADSHNHRVRRVSPGGVISTVAGDGTRGFGGDNGPATSAQLNEPWGVFATLDGHLFIADSHNQRVRRVTPQGVITTIAGSGTAGFGGDNGPATGAQLNHPFGVFVSLDGHIYIADTWNHRVRRVSPQGVITTIAGNGTQGFGGDNGPATSAQLNWPRGVFVSSDNYLYIADESNHRVRVVNLNQN